MTYPDGLCINTPSCSQPRIHQEIRPSPSHSKNVQILCFLLGPLMMVRKILWSSRKIARNSRGHSFPPSTLIFPPLFVSLLTLSPSFTPLSHSLSSSTPSGLLDDGTSYSDASFNECYPEVEDIREEVRLHGEFLL